MKGIKLHIAAIIGVLCLSACSSEDVVATVKNAESAVVSGANNAVAEVSNMISVSETEPDQSTVPEDVSVSESSSIVTTQYIKKITPDMAQIRNVCNLATMKCCYNNVARSNKLKGEGLSHLGEKDRKFWIEYSGTVTIGIDMSEIEMDIDGDKITITIPPAKVLSIKNDPYEDDDITYENKKNPLSASDASEAIRQANEQLKEEFNNNSYILVNAQNQAQKLIENYIQQIGTATKVEYDIKWVYGKKENME